MNPLFMGFYFILVFLKLLIMSNLKKQRILKELSKVYNERTYSAIDFTEEGKSISTEDLHRETKIDLDSLNTLLKSMYYNDYIKAVKLHGKELTFYHITDKGFDALSDKRFVWYAPSLDKVLKVLPIIISIIALFVSIMK